MYQDCIEALVNSNLKRHILPAHKVRKSDIQETIQETPSLILGLSTLSEGVDFKEGVLGSIVIPRLPFNAVYKPATDKYTFVAEVERMMSALKQYCGRLNRTESDSGTIYIADNRVVTSMSLYGKDIVKYFDETYEHPVEFVNFAEMAVIE
jgi:Rad3-related DNA helicase